MLRQVVEVDLSCSFSSKKKKVGFTKILLSKSKTTYYISHRNIKDTSQTWTWPEEKRETQISYIVTPIKVVENSEKVGILLSLSDTVSENKYANFVDNTFSLYEITIENPSSHFLRNPKQIERFSSEYRALLNEVQVRHGRRCKVYILPAVPISIAVECGRVLLSTKDPEIFACEYYNQEGFREVLKINELILLGGSFMLNVLLIKIQPIDHQILEDFESFSENKEALSFDISVFNGCSSLQFRADRKFYEGSESFNEKIEAINEELEVDYGGHAVAIERYPVTQFRKGAKLIEYSGISRWDFEADFENSGCDCLVLSVPGLKPIPLTVLRFGCDGIGAMGFCPDSIVFGKESVLSVTLPFGDVKGIALTHCNESALNPDNNRLQYTMRFQRISLPAVFLLKLL